MKKTWFSCFSWSFGRGSMGMMCSALSCARLAGPRILRHSSPRAYFSAGLALFRLSFSLHSPSLSRAPHYFFSWKKKVFRSINLWFFTRCVALGMCARWCGRWGDFRCEGWRREKSKHSSMKIYRCHSRFFFRLYNRPTSKLCKWWAEKMWSWWSNLREFRGIKLASLSRFCSVTDH